MRYRCSLGIQALVIVLICATLPSYAVAAPGDTLFADDFDDGSLSPWSVVGGDPDRVGVNQDTAQSGNSSMYLRWEPSGAESPAIDADVPGAELSLWVRRGDDNFSEDPDSGEDLRLQYLDNGDNWRTLDNWPGDGTPGETFSASYSLPPDARHSALQLRLQLLDGSGDDFDYWHIDDVEIVETMPSPVVEYRMEDGPWDGSAGEVTDASGNGHDARAEGDASTASANPAIGGEPGTCAYAELDGSGDYIVDSDAGTYLNGLSAVTVMAWVRNTASTPVDAGIFNTGTTSGQDNNLGIRYDAAGASSGSTAGLKASLNTDQCPGDQDCIQVETESNLQVQDQWQHVAMTWSSGGPIRVFVDGQEVQAAVVEGSGNLGGVIDDVDFLRVGQSSKGGEDWQGEIDEFRVYGAALDGSVIQTAMNETHPCGFCASGAAFSDSFEDGNLDPPWQRKGGPPGRVGVNDDTAADGSQSMFLRHDSVRVESPQIDLSGATSADLSLWVRRGADSFSNYPEGGEDLVLEYLDSSDNWNSLQTFPGGGSPGEIFQPNYSLPADAFHSDFSVRLRLLRGSGNDFDYWHIDNVCLTSTGAGVDHFAVNHDGSAVTCGAERITITAHNNGDQPVDPGNVTSALDTSTGEGTWAQVITGSGTLSDATAGDGAASYTWPGNGETSVTLAFNYTTVTQAEDPESVNFDIAGGNEGTGEDPDLVVSRTGFRISDGSGNATVVPPQIAGKASDTDPGSTTLALQAVRASDNDPSVCEPYFPDGGDVEVELGAECNDPATCAGRELAVTNDGNTTAIDTSDDDGSAGAASYEPVTLRFGTDAEAPLVLSYPDAGQIQLHARHNPIDDGTTSPPVVEYVTGSSNRFVVRPFGFDVAVPDDTSATGPTGAAPFTAGVAFRTTVTGRVWQAADDGDADGVPDSGADLSDNAATPNFGQEATPEDAVLTPTVADPASGSDGTLSNATFDSFSSGSQTRNDVAWDEVGYVDLGAALGDGDYLGSGSDVTGSAAMVGRFIPHHFTLSAASLTHRVDLSCPGASFSYIGERFGNDFTLTAKAQGGSDTTNYEGSYARLDTAAELGFGATDGSSDVSGRLSASNVTFGWTAGAGDIAAELVLARQTEEAPFDPLRVGIAPADDDSVTLQSSALDLDVDGDGTDDHAETAAPELRFGRLVVDDAGGAEIAPIDMPVRAEYWTGDTWNTNGLDNCTTLALASQIEFTNGTDTVSGDQPIAVGGGQTSITSGDLLLSGGATTVTFAAPGAGNTGWVDLTAQLGEGSPDYFFLRGDPDDDGVWDTDPTGRVTFGIYGGNERRIDVRRVPVD